MSATLEKPMVQVPRANIRPVDAQFPQGEFATVEDVPIFREHETVSRETGQELKFGQKELQQIVDRCNRRISETGDYAAITFGHTSDEPGAKQPDLGGYAGPFKLGLLGEGETENYCILCDMHIYQDEYERFKRHPRRSPELWLEDGYEGMFLDPIALLGAEPPRLDMGMTMYGLRRSGRKVERYMAAAPSAANTFIPSEKKRKYSAESPERKSSMALQPEDIRLLIDAFMQTDVMQEVQTMLVEQRGTNATPELGEEPGIEGLGEPGGPAQSPGMLPDTAPEDAIVPPEGPIEAEMGPEAETIAPPMLDSPKDMPPTDEAQGIEEEEEDTEEYRAGRPKGGTPGGYRNRGGSRGSHPPKSKGKRYAADETENLEDDDDPEKKDKKMKPEQYKKMESDVVDLRAQLEVEKGKRVDAERYSRLEGLHFRHVFDMDEQHERCRYSKMNDETFSEHCTMIEKNFTPIPGDLPSALSAGRTHAGSDMDGREKYSKADRDAAVRRCVKINESGGTANYKEELEKVHSGATLSE